MKREVKDSDMKKEVKDIVQDILDLLKTLKPTEDTSSTFMDEDFSRDPNLNSTFAYNHRDLLERIKNRDPDDWI